MRTFLLARTDNNSMSAYKLLLSYHLKIYFFDR